MTTPQPCLQVNQDTDVLTEWDLDEPTRVDEITQLPMRQMRDWLEADRIAWENHVEKHVTWGRPPMGAGPVFTDPNCTYCQAVRS